MSLAGHGVFCWLSERRCIARRSLPGSSLSLADSRLDQRLQLTLFEHFQNDVATADQLTGNPQLGESRPVGVFWQLGTNFRVLQNVDIGEFFATTHYRLACTGRKPALRRIGRAFHVQQHRGLLDLLFNGFDNIHGAPRLVSDGAYCTERRYKSRVTESAFISVLQSPP